MIRRFLIIIGLSMICLSANAQFGLRSSYNVVKAKEWNDIITEIVNREEEVFTKSISLTLDYWLKLPNHRIEFFPNISMTQANNRITNIGVGILDIDLGLNQIGLGLITHFYVLDMVGDCDCPTFSKQGGFFKKGFFVMAGAGADYSRKNLASSGYSDGSIDFKFLAGMGLDIGINDLITLSPFIQYQYYPNISWHDLRNADSSLRLIQMGVRLGLRPDYK